MNIIIKKPMNIFIQIIFNIIFPTLLIIWYSNNYGLTNNMSTYIILGISLTLYIKSVREISKDIISRIRIKLNDIPNISLEFSKNFGKEILLIKVKLNDVELDTLFINPENELILLSDKNLFDNEGSNLKIMIFKSSVISSEYPSDADIIYDIDLKKNEEGLPIYDFK